MLHKAWNSKGEMPFFFQGHPSNFKVTRYKTSPILTQIGRFRTIGRSQLSNPSDLPCYLFNSKQFLCDFRHQQFSLSWKCSLLLTLFSRPLFWSIYWWMIWFIFGFEYIAKNQHMINIVTVTGICVGSQGKVREIFFCQTHGNPSAVLLTFFWTLSECLLVACPVRELNTPMNSTLMKIHIISHNYGNVIYIIKIISHTWLDWRSEKIYVNPV